MLNSLAFTLFGQILVIIFQVLYSALYLQEPNYHSGILRI